MRKKMEKLAISIDDFAAMLGIGKTKAYELSRRNDFPAIRLGRRVVIPVDKLKEWLEKHTPSIVE